MSAAQLRRVNAESFAHYRLGLIELLLDAVKHGASVGFMADFDEAQARTYLSGVQASIEEGSLLLWVVVRDEQVIASVQLALCLKTNGLNRRQIEILQIAVKEPGRVFTVKDVSAQFQTAENTSRSDLKKLSGLGLMETLKTGNAVDFIAIEDLKERLKQ